VPLRKSRAYVNAFLGLVGRVPLQVRYYHDPAMYETVRQVVNEVQPDLLYAHTIRMGPYIVSHAACARVLAMQISMTLNYRRLAEHASGLLVKMLHSVEYHKLKAFEYEFARRFDQVLLISRYDLGAIEQKAPLNNVFFSPHGVDFAYFAPDTSVEKEPNTLILTGNMNYHPNVDAVLYFYREILPLVRAQVPDVRLYLVGADPSPEIQALVRDPSVQVTGRVPDLRVYMNRVQVAIDPLRVGAGLQNKVLEGMSMGLPMVITSVANEGIQAIDGENVLIADSPGDFAGRILSLFHDPAQQMKLGAAARDFIIQNWSWDKHFGDLEQRLASLISERKQSQ
jgi:glycosyltransferase involved in cell wall biosynthesis